MDAKWKRRLMGTAMILVAGMGCNPILAPFLLGRDDSRTPAEFALKVPPERAKKSEDARVVVLVSTAPGLIDLIGIDKTISNDLVKTLDEALKSNKEKVTIIPSLQVEKWKSDNPGWKLLSPVEIGQKFKADYVINLEVQAMQLYQPLTRNQFFQGKAVLDLSAYDMAKGTEVPDFKTELNQEYPKGHGIDASELTQSKFKSEFVKRIVNDIAWKFTPHETKDRFTGE